MTDSPEVKKFKTPQDWLQGLKDHWKSDAVSGFLVFLIALPLSLGIAKGSFGDKYAMMGLFTAIIGGVVVTFLSGSYVTIKGPAAGLMTLVASSVLSIDKGGLGYEGALAAMFVAALVQVLFGFLKFGNYVSFFPLTAVHGMLASIGLMIIIKQFKDLFGSTNIKPAPEIMELFRQIPEIIMDFNLNAMIIGLGSLIIMFVMVNVKNKFIKSIPGAFVALIFSIILSLIIGLDGSFKIKVSENVVGEIMSSIHDGTFIKPDFSNFASLTFFKFVLTFALIGSIESLLTSKAIDNLDPFKRKSNYNKDVIAVGVGNALTSLIGALPMISEVARSSYNVGNGAKTRWANFFHGLFLLLALVFIPFVINLIPKAALAAMLVFTGYRLASPKEFIKTFKIGPEQLLVFVTTILVTLFSDLLIGIACGVFLELIIHIGMGASFKDLFRSGIQKTETADVVKLQIGNAAAFTNVIGFQQAVDSITHTKHIEVDFANTGMIDHTFMETLHHYEDDFSRQGGKLEPVNMDNLTPYSSHPMAARKLVSDALFSPSKLELSSRQLQLSEFATKNNYDFEHKKTKSILKFRFTPFIITRKALYGENLILGSKPYGNFFFADILVKEGAMLTQQEYHMTVMHLFEIKGVTIPDFSLEKEGFLDMIKNFQGYTDINFNTHTEFSKNYYLTGPKEEDVRSFFTDEVLQYFEKKKGFYIEAKNNSLMLHEQIDYMGVKEIEDTLSFVDGLFDILRKNSK